VAIKELSTGTSPLRPKCFEYAIGKGDIRSNANETRGSVVVEALMVQAGKSRVGDPMM
jgi:hypothetical protein